jgi:hypothetical protein
MHRRKTEEKTQDMIKPIAGRSRNQKTICMNRIETALIEKHLQKVP